MTIRDLFGGAIVADVPERFIDVSNFRVVPDNQELMCDIDTDQSIIVELLSLVSDVPADKAAEFHFEELAAVNEAHLFEKLQVREIANEELPHLTRTVHKYFIFGRQQIAKFNEEAKNVVNIYMAVIRIPSVTTDILITLNEPVQIDQASSSAKNIDTSKEIQPAPKVFEEILRTFKIKDWSLFCAD